MLVNRRFLKIFFVLKSVVHFIFLHFAVHSLKINTLYLYSEVMKNG